MERERQFVRVSAVVIFCISFLAVLGWIFDIQTLKSLHPDYVSMKMNTAICFMASAAGVFLYARGKARDLQRGHYLVFFTVLISVATLAEYSLGVNLYLDELLVKDNSAVGADVFPGRMALLSAVGFLLMGAGLWGTTGKRWVRVAAQMMFHTVTLVSFVVGTGYMFGVPTFQNLPLFNSMAFQSALMMFLLSIISSVLLPGYGFARLFLGKETGSVMARRLFPIMVLSVSVLGIIRLQTHWFQVVTVEMGVASYGALFMLISLLLIQNTADKLNVLDRKRQHAESELKDLNLTLEQKVLAQTEKLRESNKRNRIFVEGAPSAIAMFDNEMNYVAVSQQWLTDYGLDGQQIIGRSHYEIFPEIGADWKQIHRECLAGAINRNSEAYLKREDGKEQWLMWDVRPWYESEHEIGGILMYTADITEIKKRKEEVKALLTVSMEQNERLENFAHIVSHNLRAHSGNISVLLDLFLQEHPELKNNELIEHQLQATENLKETIAHLNEVVAINTTVLGSMKPLSLHRFVERTIKSVEATAATKGVVIHNNVPEDANAMGVEAYLDSIILNLLTNGIKYSSPDRPRYIKVDARNEGNYMLLTIQDNGVGMDMKTVGDKLFGMYKTFHGNSDAKGLGLFITRNQVEAMGGKVLCDSEPDAGTTFKIYLKNEQVNMEASFGPTTINNSAN
jgi:PAS domain S-box-containing protein